MFSSLLIECTMTNNEIIDGKLDFSKGKIVLSLYPESYKQCQKLTLQSSKMNLKAINICDYLQIVTKDQTKKIDLKKSKIINNYSTKDCFMIYELSEVSIRNNDVEGKKILNITCSDILQRSATDSHVLKFEIDGLEVSITKYNDLRKQSELFCPQQYEDAVIEFLSFYFNKRVCVKANCEADEKNTVTIFNTELLDSPQKVGLFEYYNETYSLCIEDYLSSITVKTTEHKDAIRYIRSYISANNYNPVGQFLTYYSIICLFGNGYIVDKSMSDKSHDEEQYDSAIKEMRIDKKVIQGINEIINKKLSGTLFGQIGNVPRLRNEIVHGLIAPEIEDLLYYESSINDFLRAISFGIIFYVLTGKRELSTEWEVYDVFENS